MVACTPPLLRSTGGRARLRAARVPRTSPAAGPMRAPSGGALARARGRPGIGLGTRRRNGCRTRAPQGLRAGHARWHYVSSSFFLQAISFYLRGRGKAVFLRALPSGRSGCLTDAAAVSLEYRAQGRREHNWTRCVLHASKTGADFPRSTGRVFTRFFSCALLESCGSKKGRADFERSWSVTFCSSGRFASLLSLFF